MLLINPTMKKNNDITFTIDSKTLNIYSSVDGLCPVRYKDVETAVRVYASIGIDLIVK